MQLDSDQEEALRDLLEFISTGFAPDALVDGTVTKLRRKHAEVTALLENSALAPLRSATEYKAWWAGAPHPLFAPRRL